jgi:hypothetical protein
MPAVFIDASAGLVVGAHLVSDGTSLYVNVRSPAPQGKILACPLAGCPPTGPTLVVDNQARPTDVWIDGTEIYWTNYGSNNMPDGNVLHCTLPNCGTQVELARGQRHPAAISVLNGVAYWVNQGDIVAPTGSVVSCKVSGCGGVPTTLASSLDNPTSIATDGTMLYWSTLGVTTQSTLYGCALGACDGGAPLSGNELAAEDLVLANGSAFWVMQIAGAGRVRTCTLPTCATPADVYRIPDADGGRQPNSVAVDPINVYFTISADQSGAVENGSVAYCPRAGCGGAENPNLRYVAQGLPSPDRLLEATKRLYWTSSSGVVWTIGTSQ